MANSLIHIINSVDKTKLHYFTDSFTDAAENGQQVDGPNGMSQDPSFQTVNVRNEEEGILPQVSDQFTHHDPLEAHADAAHGSEHSRRHRHRSKSHSSRHRTPVGHPTQSGKDQEQRRASCKATANPSTEGKFISSSHCVLCHQ